MEEILLLNVDDIPRYTNISGNIDVDRLTVGIRTAQRSELRRILGVALYEKIKSDFENGTLDGLYKTIYENFVVDILVNYSAYNIVIFNSLKVDNAGNFYYEPKNARSADMEDTEKIAQRYLKLGASIELEFNNWIKKNKVAEYPNSGSCSSNNNSFKFNWVL